ncbi:MAG TPA: CPBP family glutamic-type intramembrane protease [Chitinophagaceae bacterium]|nr:CPBP family glutamic-type intramembrane protease [Chitinophagaceae bacterium]
MKTIYKYFFNFFTTLNYWYFISVISITAVLIFFNYGYGLEKKIIDTGTWVEKFGKYFCLFFFAYASSFFLQLLFNRQSNWRRQKWFWFILFIGPFLFSLKVNFTFLNPAIKSIWSFPYFDVFKYSINWIVRAMVIMLSVFLIWMIRDRKEQPFYGIARIKKIKPYLITIALLFPLIIAASTQPDFLKVYPKAKNINEIPLCSIKDYGYYFLFELCYGFDFVSIEFFFRGFLILTLIKICGKDAIIPMAAFYCTIHFGKPLGEAVSSFFGGLLLGIVSYNTRSVWGGLLVHLGIAWLMEIGGWIGAIVS